MASPLPISSLTSIILLFTLILLCEHGTVAVEYTVGDSDGWINGNNYLRWSQKYNFSVGDVLVFNYVKGQHDAYQVTEDTFRSCNSSTGVVAIYDSGNDRVTLTEATKYWFICNTKGHCQGGMRFGITVRSAEVVTVPLPAAPPSEAPPPPGPIAAGNAAAAAGGKRWCWMWGLVVFYWLLSLLDF